MGYPRRAALIRSLRASLLRAAAAVTVAVGLAGATAIEPMGLGVVPLAAVLASAGRLEARRAKRARIGAASEALVADRLAVLEAARWRVRHGMCWGRLGDIDHVVEAPGGQCFAVETKTSRYTEAHLARTRAAARHLSRRKRPCTPIVCVARRRGLWWIDEGVVVVSADLLTARLRQLARGA